MNIILFATLAGIIPSLIWLFFWTREDIAHPESRMIITLSFFGGMAAVLAAIIAEQQVTTIFSDQSFRYTAWAATEEIVKLLAVTAIALFSNQNDEPIDAMIYFITVALGFAALENSLFIIKPLMDGEIIRSVVMGNMRFIGATLVHVVSSACIGFALGWSFYRNRIYKTIALIIGLVAAVSIHSAFNLSIISGGSSDALRTFGWIWGAVVTLIILFEEVKAIHPRFVR